ncbi:MAG: hypothetical protein ISS78_09300 [Phycisphaerae bacterium]|nr:hypothetical protein [Phycisphaerae bacterium]
MKTRLLLVVVLVAGAVWAAAWGQPGAPAKASKKIDITQPAGIAEKYPGDKGIIRDPAVILHEDFEAAQIDKKRWPNISNKAGALKLVRDPANVHGGKQALQVTATLGKNTGGHLFRRFKKGYDQLYARFRVKFAKDCDYIHHFVHMVAQLPPTPWPTGGAGLRPAGDKKFSLAIEPWGRWGKYPPPGGWHFYCYWWKMKASGDGKFWGRGFADEAYAVPKRGRWYCVEFMGKANTPGKEDGQIAVWIDGRKHAHHHGINWRSSEKLKINSIWLMLYVTAHSAKKNKVNTVWFDDVVVATEYIGPPRRK